MGQYCSTDDTANEENYAALVSKFNERRKTGNGAYGTQNQEDTNNLINNEEWHLVSPSDRIYDTASPPSSPPSSSSPSSPTKDDSTNSVMLYDIQYRMTNSHVVYVLHLKFRGIPNPGWSITKRYRQFSNLHKMLLKRYKGDHFRKLPAFPSKQFFSNQRLAQERQVKLGTYIRTLLAMELQSPQVADFLGIPSE
jgi:hypothetical protein